MSKPKKSDDLTARIRKYIRSKELGLLHYRRAGALMESLSKEMVGGEPVEIDKRQTATLVDKFDGKDVVSKMTFIDRWDIKISG